MTTILVPGVPSSRKTPGVYMNVVLGGPGAGSGVAPERLICVGNVIATALTGATPSFSVAAGTAAIATPVQVFSETDAIEKFGRGGELHLQCAAAFDENPNVPLWACPLAEAAGAARGTATLTLTGTAPTTDLTISISVDGVTTEFVFASGDSIDNLGTAIAQAVLDQPDWPITAQTDTGTDVVTFTAKQKGTRGNNIQIKVNITAGTRTYKLRTGGLAATVSGTTLTMNAQNIAAGSGTETTTFATVVSNMAAERWHRIALATEDSTNITAMGTQITTKASPTQMLWEQCIAGNVKDLTTSTTGAKDVAAAVLNPRVQLIWHYQSDRSPGEIAAQCACARLMGDSFVGGSSAGETSDPSANLDALLLATITTQELVADKPLPTEVETALNYGVTPLVESPSRPGYTQIVRSVTTRFKDATGALNYAVLDTTEVTVTDYVAEQVRSQISTNYARAKVADDSSDGTPPKVAGVVTASMLKSFIAGLLRIYEEAGIIVNVSTHMAQLAVVRDLTSRGRFNADIPVEPAAGFHVFGGNVRQLAA